MYGQRPNAIVDFGPDAAGRLVSICAIVAKKTTPLFVRRSRAAEDGVQLIRYKRTATRLGYCFGNSLTRPFGPSVACLPFGTATTLPSLPSLE